jgi:hypothetical protein
MIFTLAATTTARRTQSYNGILPPFSPFFEKGVISRARDIPNITWAALKRRSLREKKVVLPSWKTTKTKATTAPILFRDPMQRETSDAAYSSGVSSGVQKESTPENPG